jgi:hypothetical protein
MLNKVKMKSILPSGQKVLIALLATASLFTQVGCKEDQDQNLWSTWDFSRFVF